MVKMISDNDILNIAHNKLHAIAFTLKQLSEEVDRMAELLHTIDGSQTRLDEHVPRRNE